MNAQQAFSKVDQFGLAFTFETTKELREAEKG